ncbi:hypothetical protein [Desulforhopalus sp. IMCC35007]|uniref:hypothetical protein n=1 Tax=Desulforhopalus sp. IMCC35007 TaxID=2569543 RepID=UPI00145E6CC2|nr:hypothetical protein [Desulforhopalus sp. IMCC35007]
MDVKKVFWKKGVKQKGKGTAAKQQESLKQNRKIWKKRDRNAARGNSAETKAKV